MAKKDVEAVFGKDISTIGHVSSSNNHDVIMKTKIGGSRRIRTLDSVQLPRIC